MNPLEEYRDALQDEFVQILDAAINRGIERGLAGEALRGWVMRAVAVECDKRTKSKSKKR